MIAVGAVDASKQVASFSDRTRQRPGPATWSRPASTSSRPKSGRAALVSGRLLRRPASSAVQRLWCWRRPRSSAPPKWSSCCSSSATDLEAPRPDPVYGHGLVDLDAALRPAGPARACRSEARSRRLRAAVGDDGLRLRPAFERGPEPGKAIFLDGYSRAYWLDLDEIGSRRGSSGPDLEAWLDRRRPIVSASSVPLGPALALDLTVAGHADPSSQRAIADAAVEDATAFALDLGIAV